MKQILRQVPFVFRQTTCTYSESWGPVETFFWGRGQKMTQKLNFGSKNFFPSILPKKHSLITQKRFWPSFGVFPGFLGFPRTICFGGLSLYFHNFFDRKRSEVESSPQRVLVFYLFILFYFFFENPCLRQDIAKF